MKNYYIITLFTLLFFSCESIVFDDDEKKIDLIRTGFTLYKNEKYDLAEETFKLALATGTVVRKDTALTGLGFTQIRLYKLDSALVHLDNALTLNPTMSEALYAKMILYYAYKKDYSIAIDLGNRIISNDPNWMFLYDNTSNIKDVYLHLALSEFELQHYVQSYEFTQKISSKILDPNASNFTSELAKLHSELSIELKAN